MKCLAQHCLSVRGDREVDRNRFVFVDSRCCRVEAELGDESLSASPRSCRASTVSTERPSTFHGNPDAARWCAHPDRVRRLDHRRVSTTLDFYANVTPAGDRFAANALQAVMSRALV